MRNKASCNCCYKTLSRVVFLSQVSCNRREVHNCVGSSLLWDLERCVDPTTFDPTLGDVSSKPYFAPSFVRFLFARFHCDETRVRGRSSNGVGEGVAALQIIFRLFVSNTVKVAHFQYPPKKHQPQQKTNPNPTKPKHSISKFKSNFSTFHKLLVYCCIKLGIVAKR